MSVNTPQESYLPTATLKAWGFTSSWSGAPTLIKSNNIASAVAGTSTPNRYLDITFTTAMASANYLVKITNEMADNSSSRGQAFVTTKTTAGFRLLVNQTRYANAIHFEVME